MAAVAHVDSLLRNSDHAFDAAYNATDYTADHATNHGADGTGGALTCGGTLLASTHNALGLGCERRRNSGNNDNSHRELRLHEQTPLLMFAVSTIDAKDLIPALWHHREANVAAIDQIVRLPVTQLSAASCRALYGAVESQPVLAITLNPDRVIPGATEGGEPGMIPTSRGLWIPGSRARARAPE